MLGNVKHKRDVSFTVKAIFTAVLCAVAGSLNAKIILVENGQNTCPIYYPAEASKTERLAAQELAEYLGLMSGAEFSVVPMPDDPPERGVFVGDVVSGITKDLAPDDFRFKTSGQKFFIVGGSPRGTLYGVYALLEEEFGCRWWSRNEEYVPTGRNTLILEKVDRDTVCPFSMYDVWNREAQSRENNFEFKARTKSSESFSGGHTLYPLLKSYAEDHPDIYPMNKEGERKANNLHFCYLASGIAEALAEALAVEVEKRKGRVDDIIYFAGMGDWYGGMCMCPECSRMYKKEAWVDPDGREKQGYSATLLKMINRTAEILEKKYPGIRVGTFAYMSLEAPPAKTVPGDNVIIRVPRLRHCTVHSVGECEKNASFLRNLERWTDIAPDRVYVWEYGANFGHNFIFPFPCLTSLASNIKIYHEMGVRGVQIQGNYVSPGGDLAVLKNYVWRKLFWNPDLDIDEVVREFCDGYYGPASEHVREYVTLLDKSVREPEMKCADEFAAPSYLTNEVLAAMRKEADAAIAAAGDKDPYLRRVKEAVVGLDAFALWRAGPLEEKGDRLIRADVGEYTYDRARDMLNYIRDASPREWGLGRPYQMSFLALQGGSLARLARGKTEVVVAPVMNGRIRQISFDGEPLFYVEENVGAKGYPHLGGSVVKAGTRLMTLVESGQGEHETEMIGESGIASWSVNTKQYIRQKVKMPEDNTVEIEFSGRRAERGVADRSASVETTYRVGSEPGMTRVFYTTDGKEWAPVTMEPGEVVNLDSLKAVRVCFVNKNCELSDYYQKGNVTSATLLLDAEKQTLKANVILEKTELPLDSEVEFLNRKIVLKPL